MTQLAFVTNFANPAFMASMEPGCALGSLITSANRFMDVLPGDDYGNAAEVAAKLEAASNRVTGMMDVFKSAVPPPLALVSEYRHFKTKHVRSSTNTWASLRRQ